MQLLEIKIFKLKIKNLYICMENILNISFVFSINIIIYSIYYKYFISMEDVISHIYKVKNYIDIIN